MDSHYNFKAAATALEALNQDSEGHAWTSLSHISALDIADLFKVHHLPKPKSWVLVPGPCHESKDAFEIVFSIQGVLKSKNLPPFDNHQIPRQPGRARFLRQHVQISGLNLPYFKAIVDNALAIHALFERSFPEGQLEIWHPNVIANDLVIQCSNRIFSPAYDADVSSSSEVQIPAAWDPTGRLSAFLGNELVFWEENLVLYYRKSSNNEFIPATPVIFRVGDIVELQVSLTVVPIGPKKYRMMMIFRSMALLEDLYSNCAVLERRTVGQEANLLAMPLKRNFGYLVSDKETSEEVVKKMRRMNVD